MHRPLDVCHDVPSDGDLQSLCQKRKRVLPHGSENECNDRKCRARELSFMGHTSMEDRSGLVVAAALMQAMAAY